MAKLYRVTAKHKYSWKPKRSLYVIAKDKAAAITYVNDHKRDEYTVCSTAYLGDEISGVCFSPNTLRDSSNVGVSK